MTAPCSQRKAIPSFTSLEHKACRVSPLTDGDSCCAEPSGRYEVASSISNFGASPCGLDFFQLRGERPTVDRIVGSGVDESCDAVAVDENVDVTSSSPGAAVGSWRRVTAASACSVAFILRRQVVFGA